MAPCSLGNLAQHHRDGSPGEQRMPHGTCGRKRRETAARQRCRGGLHRCYMWPNRTQPRARCGSYRRASYRRRVPTPLSQNGYGLDALLQRNEIWSQIYPRYVPLYRLDFSLNCRNPCTCLARAICGKCITWATQFEWVLLYVMLLCPNFVFRSRFPPVRGVRFFEQLMWDLRACACGVFGSASCG